MDIDEIYSLSKIDRWFLKNIEEIVEFEKELEVYKSDLPIFSQAGTLFRRADEEGQAVRFLRQADRSDHRDSRERRCASGV